MTDRSSMTDDARRQAHAPASRPFDAAAFAAIEETELRWLGMAGFLVNARGTTIMIDPLLGDFDMPVLIDFPIAPEQVPHLDAVLVTHSDNDPFSVPTCRRLAPVTGEYHSARYLDGLIPSAGLPPVGHHLGHAFRDMNDPATRPDCREVVGRLAGDVVDLEAEHMPPRGEAAAVKYPGSPRIINRERGSVGKALECR